MSDEISIPNVSVIIPLYNKAPYIVRSINSVLTQTVYNFELIVVNDGSTDGGDNLVRCYDDQRIILIDQKNQGVSAARNNGVNIARADLVAFLDADDMWESTFIETILQLVSLYPSAGIYATARDLVYGNTIKKINLIGLPSQPWEGILPSYFKICCLSGHSPTGSSSVAIKKSVYEDVGGFNVNYRLSEDNELWTKIAFKYPVVYSTKICAHIHQIASNKATHNLTSVDTPPVSAFVHSIPKEQLAAFEDEFYLKMWAEYSELEAAYDNIGAGDMKKAKNNLNNITISQYRLKKNILLVITYLPLDLGRYVPYIYIFVKSLCRKL